MAKQIAALTCCLMIFASCFLASGKANAEQAESWLRLAEAACNEITDQESADRAFSRLHSIHVKSGAAKRASELTPRIESPALRSNAHIALAEHYARVGENVSCVAELKRANAFARTSVSRDKLIDAYLDLAKAPDLAIALVESQEKTPTVKQDHLCEALASRGHLEEALQVANVETDPKTQSRLKLRIAQSAAKAARIADTELAVEQVVMERATDYYKQGVWLTLAEALYKDKQFEAARRFAERVTHQSIRRRRHSRLRQIAAGPQPEKAARPPAMSTIGASPELVAAVSGKDPEAAKRAVAEMIAQVEANPIEPTTGQFGPSNQRIRLAMTRAAYAKVALLYDQAGDREEALKNLKIAEDTIPVLVEQNAFMAWLSLLTQLEIHIQINDVEGLKRIATQFPAELWVGKADRIIAKILATGEVAAAQGVARKVLSVKYAFGSPGDLPTSEISCFVLAGETQAAFDLLKTNDLGTKGANACEHAGGAMIETKQDKLLRKWLTELPPTPRAHVCLGAAKMAKELQAKELQAKPQPRANK